MAKEISLAYTASLNLYAVIKTATGQYVNGTAPEAWNATHWTSYAVAITEYATATGQYSADFPAVVAGAYRVEVYQRAGGSAATSDGPPIAEGEIQWDGTAEVTLASRSTYAGGAVASVTGAVGSVAGSVAGNVAGSVGSLVGYTTPPTVAAIRTEIDTNSTQLTSIVASLAAFAGLQITGTVASSPSPTSTAFTVTLDAAVSGSTVAADIIGLYLTFRGGAREPAARAITGCTVNSTTSLALTFTSGFAAAPATGNAVSISS